MIGTLKRKSLRHPDSFVTTVRNAFMGFIGHPRGMIVTTGSLILIGVLGVLFFNHRTHRTIVAKNAYYLAEKELSLELKEVEKSENTAKEAQSILFQRLDVNQKFPRTLQKFKQVYQDFSGTRLRYDAAVQLGDLYFNHGDFVSARAWYENAIGSAPSTLEEALALSALGYTHENLSQPAAAIPLFQKALNLGEGSLKGDLLLSLARSYEAIHDGVKARSTYEQILTDLPGTDWAKSAEVFKSQMH